MPFSQSYPARSLFFFGHSIWSQSHIYHWNVCCFAVTEKWCCSCCGLLGLLPIAQASFLCCIWACDKRCVRLAQVCLCIPTSSYYSYTRLWLLLISMCWRVIKNWLWWPRGGLKTKKSWKLIKSSFSKVGQHGMFDFNWKYQLTSWTILDSLYTIWPLNKLTLVSSQVETQAQYFLPKN